MARAVSVPKQQQHHQPTGRGQQHRIRVVEAAAPRFQRKTSPFWRFRPTLLVVTVAWFGHKYLQPLLLPYGPAAPRQQRIVFSLVDYANDSLQAKHGKLQKIHERLTPGATPLIQGPETVLFDAHGILHVMTEDAKLVTLTDFVPANEDDPVHVLATAREVAYLGGGRPLGGCFSHVDGSLYIADAHLGLMRLPPPSSQLSNRSQNVELIASRVRDEEADNSWSPLRYVDDVVVGPKTGRVYFTDATDISPDRVGTTWDVLFASKLDSIRGKRIGRVLMYDPLTDHISILARNLSFPNGISVNPDETFLVFAETFGLSLNVLDLKSGQLRQIEGNLPGYPDGIDCSPTDTGLCYSVMISAVVPVHRILNVLPDWLDRMFRTLLMMMPRSLAPPAQPYGGVAEVDVAQSKIRRILQDPTAKDIGMLSGVTVHENKLYLGSLENNFIGVYDLKE